MSHSFLQYVKCFIQLYNRYNIDSPAEASTQLLVHYPKYSTLSPLRYSVWPPIFLRFETEIKLVLLPDLRIKLAKELMTARRIKKRIGFKHNQSITK